MIPVLPQRCALKVLKFALLQPQPGGLSNGDAGAFRGVHAAGNLVASVHEKAVRLLFGAARLDVAPAVLVEVVGDPRGPDLVAALPAALADGCHRLPFLKRSGPRCSRPPSCPSVRGAPG